MKNLARLLALDYGKVRTGIAVTDELQLIASALKTVPTNTLLEALKEYLGAENVETIIIGEPRQMNNEVSESEVLIQKFMEQLEAEFPGLSIVRQDERFTSKMAKQSLLDSGHKKKKRRDKSLVDEVSATLILQAYMERIKN